MKRRLTVLGVVLFGTAGTLRWPQAWVYLAWAAAISFGGGFWLARHDPALLTERLGSLSSAIRKAGTRSSWSRCWRSGSAGSR